MYDQYTQSLQILSMSWKHTMFIYDFKILLNTLYYANEINKIQ